MSSDKDVMSVEQCPTLAIAQRSIWDHAVTFPLFPAIVNGCASDCGAQFRAPVEVDYDYARVDRSAFDQVASGQGIDQWSMLLPPLVKNKGLGEGNTALVEMPALAAWAGIDTKVLIKDESRNPTWSHKDRLNRCTASAAALSGASGIVVASSGNHGASAAAYSARVGLPCVVLASSTAPAAMQTFINAYGATVVAVPPARRWPLLREIVDRLGFHPVSNVTEASHTGHAFGTEGYKTIAYELFIELGREVPSAVLIPTGYGEIAYGVWKGFVELKQLGLTGELPRIVVCETSAYGAHARAINAGTPASTVKAVGPTDALSIAVEVGGHRAVAAALRSGGEAILVSDAEMRDAQAVLAHQGIWAELSAASSVAALRKLPSRNDGRPVVCISTSSGFKDVGVGSVPLPSCDGDWREFSRVAKTQGLRGL
ncbi:MAG: threonine synthase [Rhizobiales bacterium 62-47]|nr:pyridoxal-phosphate dependent enzyme [Hyphomicrobiales bacterium]OJY12253.1 MAG: threonine synthase [Rhizobiales bacterium 62-47]